MTSSEWENKEELRATKHLKGDYQIAICKDGNFAVTFDTANLLIKILENTDYRPSKFNYDKNFSQIHSKSENINKTIAHFKIKDTSDNFIIDEFYRCDSEAEIKNDDVNDSSSSSNNKVTTEVEDKFKWSIDISNLRKRDNKDDKGFILVAVSRVNAEEDMKGTNEDESDYKEDLIKRKHTFQDLENFEDKEDTTIDIFGTKTKGTAIYCLKLEKKSEELEEFEKKSESPKKERVTYAFKENTVDIYHSSKVSGICKFIDKDESENNVEQERFIILNFRGIYNFEIDTEQEDINFYLNEKFKYPKSIRRELDNWYTNNIKDDCMKRLRSCIYDKYFMVTQYKDDVRSLEVYNLAKMKLETITKRVEDKNILANRYNYHAFSVSKLQFCFTRGINRVRLYYIENGLQIATRKFNGIEKIHLLEFIDNDKKILIIGRDRDENLKFIIWELYNTDKIIPIKLDNCSIEDLDSRLASTSGNILHVDGKGNVTSVLKKIEKNLKELKTKSEPADRDAEPIKNNDDKHKIYYDKNATPNFNEDYKIISNFNKVANEIEPWVLNDYEKDSYCLYYNKEGTFLQLIIGRSTIQIWHQVQNDNKKKDELPNKGNPFLEYIWTNGIPVDQENEETKLQVEEFKYGSNNVNDGSNKDGSSDGKDWSRLSNFSLKVSWYIRKTKIESERRTAVIKLKDIIETFHPIRHACKALKHLNKRYVKKCLADNYNRVHKYEAIVIYIEHIVWRFAKHNPGQFKLLDIRYNFMKSLILGDCDQLIKFILFGGEGNTDNENVGSKRHIPRNKSWPGKAFIKCDDLDFNIKDDKHKKESGLKGNEDRKLENDMELAIYHCKDRELKDAVIVAYLLEYYSENATDYAGWMCTVSKALPLLFKYNYDDYIRKLFRKECFANQHHLLSRGLDPNEIPPEYLERLNNVIKFRVVKQPIDMESDWHEKSTVTTMYNIIYKIYKYVIRATIGIIYTIYEFFFTKKHKEPPLALRVVPLPGFTINNIPKKKSKYNFKKVILNIFWLIFIPQWYKIKQGDKNQLSPFSRMIKYENNDDIYDNPAIVATIDFRWQKAKNFLLFNFIRILIFAVCFAIVSWEYLVHEVISESYRNFLIIIIIIFYSLAIYLLVTEVFQLYYRGFKGYVGLFNFFDICSVVLPVAIMSFMIKEFQFSNGFGNFETIDTGLIVGISFSIFFLWIELIFHFRLLSRIGFYLYYSIIIFKTILPFFFFMLITLLAFAHSMYILLRNPVNINTKDQTLSGNATNTSTNETLNIKLKSDFDSTSRIDNPFSFFPAALMAAYFWINGDWIQRDEFDFWAVNVFTIIASVVLVIFIQNLLIAYMGGMHEKAEIEGRRSLLRHRARYIADYEALHHIHFRQQRDEPKYIYYFGHLKEFEDWSEKIKNDQNATIYEGFEEKSTRQTFKDYDEFSILKYDNVMIEDKINKIINVKNNIIDANIDYLIEKFKDQKNEIERVKGTIHTNINYLIEKLNEYNDKKN